MSYEGRITQHLSYTSNNLNLMGKKLTLYLAVLLITIPVAGVVSIENLKKISVAETILWDTTLSPDGMKIAYVAYDSERNQQIFVIDIDGSNKTKITTDPFKKWGLAWGPEKIAYVSFGKDGVDKIFIINPDGSDKKQLILDNTTQGNPAEDKPPAWAAPSWSSDGEFLVYTSLDEMANPKVYMVNANGTGKRLVFKDTFKQWSPSISPDGKNIVYVSYNDKLREELFIVDVEGKAKRQLTSDEIKKNNPFWGPDGVITYISYESTTLPNEKIFAINQDGTDRRLFVDSDYKQRSPSWSLEGRKFAYAAIDIAGIVKIAVGDVAGLQVVTPTPTAVPTATATPAVIETLLPTPTPAETPIAAEEPTVLKVVLTLLLVIAIIVIVMLAFLVISDIFFKK